MIERILVTALCIGFVGCSVREVRENDGVVCALTEPDEMTRQLPQSFVEGATVQLHYFTSGCMSSSCDSEREASCKVTVDGNVVSVESRAEWTEARGLVNACTADCGRITTACGSLALGEGTWTIRHGADSLTLTIPSEHDVAPCTRELPF